MIDNFTPLKTSQKKRKTNSLLIIGNLFLVVLIALIGVVYYNKTLITTQQQAAAQGCKSYDNAKDCNAACSPPKSDGQSFSCKWFSASHSCGESSKSCGYPGGGGGTTGSCPAGTTESGQFDHCNNCLALCDCKTSGGANNGTYFCSSNNSLCQTYYPQQCNSGGGGGGGPTPTETPTPTPTGVVLTPTEQPTPTEQLTPTEAPTTTPTPTPTGTPGPTSTPTPTVTGTPPPSATPTSVPQNTATPAPPVSGKPALPFFIVPGIILLGGLLL